MNILLFLCVGASIVHLGVPQVSYMTIKVPRHMPPKNSLDYAFISVECNYKSLVSTYNKVDSPMSTFQSTDGVSIFLSNDRSPGNENAQVIATNFKNPSEAKTQLNDHVLGKTSGKIKHFFGGFEESTDAVVVSYADTWKVPVSDGNQNPVQLQGTYNVMVNNNLGFTLLEIPKNQYINALIILPDKGKEAAVSAAVNDTNLAKWRKSLTPQAVNLEVPRATLYVCSALTAEIVRIDDYEYKSNKFAGKIAVTYP